KAERLSANGAGQSDRPMAFERPDGGYGSWRNPARYRQVNPLTLLEFYQARRFLIKKCQEWTPAEANLCVFL
ncbi:hypothetical protein KUU44_36060, partial [Pseudomonas aeruginosa]|nr:hypothetical protein [Pseudomonas aeruginosa]